MRMGSLAAAVKIGFIILLTQGAAAIAGEVKVMAGAALAGVMGDLGPKFERATGHTLVIQYGLSGTFKNQIEIGEAVDLAIFGRAQVDDLFRQGKIAAPPTDVCRVGIGVAVRSGAPKPDINSVAAFKGALVNAKSITYVPDGATGTHLIKVFEMIGIAEQMKPKTKPQHVAEHVAKVVADGEAELGIAPANLILSVGGAELVGLLPPELQNYLVLAAGVANGAKEPEAAKALLEYLMTSEATEVMKAKGMERVIQN